MNIILLIIISVLAVTIAILFKYIRNLTILLDDEHSKYKCEKDKYDSMLKQFKELSIKTRDLQTQLLEGKAFVDATSNSLIKEIDSLNTERFENESLSKCYDISKCSEYIRIIEPKSIFKLTNDTGNDVLVTIKKLEYKIM